LQLKYKKIEAKSNKPNRKILMKIENHNRGNDNLQYFNKLKNSIIFKIYREIESFSDISDNQ